MGDAGEAFPDGTVYYCAFSGQLALGEQADDHSWEVRVDRLTAEEQPGKETISDGIRYIVSAPYGISEGDVMRLYLPGTPGSALTEDMRMWAHLYDMEDTPVELADWLLYSEKNESGFVGYEVGEPVGIANPWTELSGEDFTRVSGVSFRVPEGAENVIWRWMESESLAELQFTLDGADFCARAQPAALRDGELMDISGIYYYWESEEKITVAHCSGILSGARADASDWVERCLWYDAAPGLMYSLSAVTENPDGLDLAAVAEQIYIPLQGNG